MSTRQTTTTPRTRTQPSAGRTRAACGSCRWVWKTRAIRSASTEPPLESAFPTPPWTPHAAPTGTTGILIDAHLHEITVG